MPPMPSFPTPGDVSPLAPESRQRGAGCVQGGLRGGEEGASWGRPCAVIKPLKFTVCS